MVGIRNHSEVQKGRLNTSESNNYPWSLGVSNAYSMTINQCPHPRRGYSRGGVSNGHYVQEALRLSHSEYSITLEPLALRVQDR
jgi:hypothetical protein